MKFNIGRWVLVMLLSLFMLGCSSIRARTDVLEQTNEWVVYPGVRQDVKDMGRLIRSEPLKPDEENSTPGWIKGVVGVILALDLPFSAVFDTVATPYDVYRIYNTEAFSKGASY